jgi:hypothetical protein
MASMVTSAPFQFKPLEQQRDGGDLVGFDVCRFLPEDEPLA